MCWRLACSLVCSNEITGLDPAGKHATGLLLENGAHTRPNKSSLPGPASKLDRLRDAYLAGVDPRPLYMFRNDRYGERGNIMHTCKMFRRHPQSYRTRLSALDDAMRRAQN